MSMAIECDACGHVVVMAGTVRIESLTLRRGEATYCWSEIDICAECFERPFGEVLADACLNFSDEAEPEEPSEVAP
jgi:hypothetical protein